MSAPAPAPTVSETPSINAEAVRKALLDIPGIVRVVYVRSGHGEEAVWVVRDEVEFERDRLIVEALTDIDVFDGHLVTAKTQGMVPDGRVLL